MMKGLRMVINHSFVLGLVVCFILILYGTDLDSDAKPVTPSAEDEFANESKRRESNVRLMGALEKYTVIAIQGFLLETGAVTEIKDHLKENFTVCSIFFNEKSNFYLYIQNKSRKYLNNQIIQERYIYLQEEGVRYLFGIPYEVPEPIEEVEEPHQEEGENSGEESHNEGIHENELKIHDHPERPESRASEHHSTKGEETHTETGDDENPEDPDHSKEIEIEEPKVVTMIPVPLPDELVGDTLLFLLESIEMKKLMEQENVEKPLLESADDYIRLKVGPEDYQDALDNFPKS